MSEGNFLIIGPSKVGKTALVASLHHAVNNRIRKRKGIDVLIRSLNDYTRELFANVSDLLATGQLPFAGTASIIDYEFMFSVLEPRTGLLGWLMSTMGKSHVEYHQKFTFMDAPGGAVFPGDAGEIDYAVMGEFRKRMIDRMVKAQGLIICVDASDINNPIYEREDEDRPRFRAAANVSKWLDDIFSRAAPDAKTGPIPMLPVKRVYICLTKCDLWAKYNHFLAEAQEQVVQQDPYEFCRELLGTGFLRSLHTWLSPQTQVAFGFSSVYGFVDGGINIPLIESLAADGAIGVQEMESWKPYQVIDPFVFLLTGLTLNPNIRIVPAKDLAL